MHKLHVLVRSLWKSCMVLVSVFSGQENNSGDSRVRSLSLIVPTEVPDMSQPLSDQQNQSSVLLQSVTTDHMIQGRLALTRNV